MSTSNKPAGPARRPLRTGLAILLGAWLASLPWTAAAGVVETDTKGAKNALLDKVGESRARPAPSGGGYQLRCWQYGKLIFEEDDLNLPPDAQVAYKLTLRERDGKRAPVHLVETLNATCLMQPSRVSKQDSGK